MSVSGEFIREEINTIRKLLSLNSKPLNKGVGPLKMGISCEINLLKPADECFSPGSTISGAVRYTLHEDQIFKKITVSLKGKGQLTMDIKGITSDDTYRNYEEYVDIDYVIHNNEKKSPLPKGSYETQFSFTLPPNIPSSLDYYTDKSDYTIHCIIFYYIRIKFEKPDFLQVDKRFRKFLSVRSRITPRYLTVPTTYGEQKTLTTLTQLFSSKKRIINMKATIKNSILPPGGQIEINYEISNNTHIVIKGVVTKLVETCTFTSNTNYIQNLEADIVKIETKKSSINCGDMQKMDIAIDIPVDQKSYEHSKLASRQYSVVIQAILPFPHFHAELKIPVQIDTEMDVGMIAVSVDNHHDKPPSYWEVVPEETK